MTEKRFLGDGLISLARAASILPRGALAKGLSTAQTRERERITHTGGRPTSEPWVSLT